MKLFLLTIRNIIIIIVVFLFIGFLADYCGEHEWTIWVVVIGFISGTVIYYAYEFAKETIEDKKHKKIDVT